MSNLKSLIAIVADGNALNRAQAREAFEIIMSGAATPAQIGGFLIALRMRGETIDEISAAVETMRSKMIPVKAPEDAIDIVGTGGDSSGSYNISTCTAIVVAGCGVTIAKHGNRSLSSKSGSAEALVELGVNLDLNADGISHCIQDAGIGFMFAPNHHKAMRHVGPARIELGTRTIFNILGPLANPASAKRQMTGVFAQQWVEPLANTLKELGTEKAWIVNGSDGMDEITTTGPTYVAELKDAKVTTFTVSPEDAGLPLAKAEDLKGGNPKQNAQALREVLQGAKNAYRDIVLFNSAASLIVADKVSTLTDGVKMAANTIDSGAALSRLDKLVEASNAATAANMKL
ncbi:Anthranilate phosphoribosyltransferase [Pseudovibrio axinellae]|uniref:Anthranilate phosphoribosyltransferase n=1 Tax=Pseudovibrio axinellae TaxID=989403 RepID=A0A166B5A3_9HYPH|nr:anthranilate phosphoribosyltransferase [Pseudovibrio axinellae]KZL21902.1 Anthranilate phosphoribosyltransferase [Pseudovibrio axinellae]SEQ83091.1 anthranilate phosphoribosyltransferase [Pseudovibrio axinellae]